MLFFLKIWRENDRPCFNSDDCENDSKVGFVSNVHSSLKNLTFSKYNKNKDEDEIEIS